MLRSVSNAERIQDIDSSAGQGGEIKTATLWERVMSACSRSFELLADSKSRFPLDM